MAVGIVGEVLFGMWNNRIQTELRIRSNVKLADAIERAANAENKSGTALGLGGTALGVADEARVAAESIDDCGTAIGIAAQALREVRELRGQISRAKIRE